MQTTRLIFTIQKDEKDALRALAAREYRDYRAQAALIIRQELERRGLLSQNIEGTKEEENVTSTH